MYSIRVANDIVPANGGKFDGGRLTEFSPLRNILYPKVWQLHYKIYFLRIIEEETFETHLRSKLQTGNIHGYLRLILLA